MTYRIQPFRYAPIFRRTTKYFSSACYLERI